MVNNNVEGLKIFKLHFKSPLHIGTARRDYDRSHKRLHSDTLYAAIIQAWAWLGYDQLLSDLIKKDNPKEGKIPFALSSLFPFTHSQEKASSTVYFLPRPFKPFHPDTFSQASSASELKQFKDVNWLDLTYFRKQMEEKKGTRADLYHVQEEYLSLQKIDAHFLDSRIQARVSVPRSPGESTPYYIERIRFEYGSGLYGLYLGPEEMWNNVEKGLLLLGQEGLGTDRNVGNGKFKLEVLDSEEELTRFKKLLSLSGSTGYTNLSLFSPEKQHNINSILATPNHLGYNLIKRGGWITTEPYLTLRKNPLYMFEEGSIFSIPPENNPSNQIGAMINVNPPPPFELPHPVWRVGRSIIIPTKI